MPRQSSTLSLSRSVETSSFSPQRLRTLWGEKNRLRRQMALTGLLLVAPATLYILIFHLVPVVYGFYLSFTRYDPLSRAGPQFHGLVGYQAILNSPQFWNALKVTLHYTFEIIPLAAGLALGLALLANRPLPGINLFRATVYLPRIISLIAASLIWLWLYSRNGLFNYMGSFFVEGHTRWLASPDLALHALVLMRVWKALGGNMVLFLAGLQTIPPQLYEAARVDGAGPWTLFRHITLPGLRPVTAYVITTNIIFIFQSFAEIFTLTDGGPLGRTTVINLLIYREAFQYNRLGQASAMAFLLFAIIFAFSYLNLRLIHREGDYE